MVREHTLPQATITLEDDELKISGLEAFTHQQQEKLKGYVFRHTIGFKKEIQRQEYRNNHTLEFKKEEDLKGKILFPINPGDLSLDDECLYCGAR